MERENREIEEQRIEKLREIQRLLADGNVSLREAFSMSIDVNEWAEKETRENENRN